MDDEKEEDKWEGERWRNVDTSVVFRDKLSPDHGFGGKAQHAQQVLLLTRFSYFIPHFYFTNVFLIWSSLLHLYLWNTTANHTHTHTSKNTHTLLKIMVLNWHRWFHEEPSMSIEPFHSYSGKRFFGFLKCSSHFKTRFFSELFIKRSLFSGYTKTLLWEIITMH